VQPATVSTESPNNHDEIAIPASYAGATSVPLDDTDSTLASTFNPLSPLVQRHVTVDGDAP
jgi:hypothetical protein